MYILGVERKKSGEAGGQGDRDREIGIEMEKEVERERREGRRDKEIDGYRY